MSQLSRHHHQILLSLAREIRQATDWLSNPDEPAPTQAEWKARLSTLQEAADAAGMQSVRNSLNNLQHKKSDRNQTHIDRSDSSTQQVLHQLADMLASLATSAETHASACMDCICEAEKALKQAAYQSSQSAQRLADCLRTLYHHATSSNREDQTACMTKLGKALKEEIHQNYGMHQRIQEIRNRFQDASRKLSKELSGLSTVPLFPGLVHLRDQIHRSGQELGKPVTLELRIGDIEVPVGQIEPINRVLDFLAHQMLIDEIEKPEERRKLGKAETASIRLTSTSNRSVINIHIEDDGSRAHAAFSLSRSIKQDLWNLRARLLWQKLPKEGTGLSLQIPTWSNTLDAIPLDTEVGRIFVPLCVVIEAFSEDQHPKSHLPVISLKKPTRPAKKKPTGCGVVLQVGNWQALLHAHTVQNPQRVTPLSPNVDDPVWVLAMVETQQESIPIFHPLPFVTLEKGQSCLYPQPLKSAAI